MARVGGLLSRAARALEKALLKRERVGTDPQGNVYFRGPRTNPNTRAEVEARWVSLSGGRGPSDYTPDMVPPEWSRWLTKGRDEPPTPEDLAKYEAERGALAQRVRVLEDEEAKRRLRVRPAYILEICLPRGLGAHAQRVQALSRNEEAKRRLLAWLAPLSYLCPGWLPLLPPFLLASNLPLTSRVEIAAGVEPAGPGACTTDPGPPTP